MGDNYGKISISPILVVVVLVLQFESQYLKNCKSIGLKVSTQIGSNNAMCRDLPKCSLPVNNNNALS